ncbi:MAG: S8 family serine peptidase [Candidatus Limnocylindria bacterium]
MRATKVMSAALATVALVVVSVAMSAGSADAAANTESLIVVLRDGENATATASDHAARYGADVSHIYTAALTGYAARVPAASRNGIARDARVAFINDDRPVYATEQTLPTGVDRIDADLSSTKAGDGTGSVSGPAVAIIDTGIDSSHPELNVKGGYNCTNRNTSNWKDGNGHGTHVAGTVAAKDNTAGVVGVAPGAPLWAVKVLNNAGSGSWAGVICGIDWVTKNVSKGIKVANMSLGGSGSDDGQSCAATTDSMKKALCNSRDAGVTYAVAAGNSSADLKDFVPAAYRETISGSTVPIVLTVTAMADFNGQPGGGAAATCRSDVDDTAADFSNFATLDADKAHTIAAPGVCILSTWTSKGYNEISGTSMASPHVAGAAALCIGSGTCTSSDPKYVIGKLMADAAAQPASYGFAEDAHSTSTKYYGYLLYAGGY